MVKGLVFVTGAVVVGFEEPGSVFTVGVDMIVVR
jgi:hypothetical protein